jgi:predicted aspartyl protease
VPGQDRGGADQRIKLGALARRYHSSMGMFQVRVRVANPGNPAQLFEEPFWVDTGALYSFVPEDRLHAIGLRPKFTREFVFADGRKERRLVGEALFEIQGLNETVTCLVVFAPAGSLYLLGATAMENFGVQVDPSTLTLHPITAVIGTSARLAPAVTRARLATSHS